MTNGDRKEKQQNKGRKYFSVNIKSCTCYFLHCDSGMFL